MSELMYKRSYKEYKVQLDGELTKAAESFVRIGYLLKVARDTDILQGSGYCSVVEFARSEYGLDKTQVSRFIHINDRFSEGGNSDRLQERYRGMGYAKLTIMLQLPDAINEELSPGYSKSEIQALKEEVDAENAVTDIEVLLEGESSTTAAVDDMLRKSIHQLGGDIPQLYEQIYKRVKEQGWSVPAIQEIMAPAGEKIYSIRIQGIGRQMISLNDAEREIRLVDIRTGEKSIYTWEDVVGAWTEIVYPEQGMERVWEELYGCDFPSTKEEVAPVQRQKGSKVEKQPKKPEKKQEQKAVIQTTLHEIERRIPEPDPAEEKPEMEEATEVTEMDGQIPGQDTIENHPEYMPPAAVLEEDIIEPEAYRQPEESELTEDQKNQITGYRAGITSGIRRLETLHGEERYDNMLSTLEDVKWRIEQIILIAGSIRKGNE